MAGTSVKVESFRGRLRLRWSHNSKRHVMALGLYDTSVAQKVAQAKASVIEADLVTGNFDPTLKKYKTATTEADKTSCCITAVELFDRFTSHREKGVIERTLEKYSAVAAKVAEYFGERLADVDADSADDFRSWLAERLAPVSMKEYLALVCTCWDWGMKHDLISDNPWNEVVKRVKVPPKQQARPFNHAEITAIVEGFSKSRYYRHYTEFVTFLFSSGCRTGEVIGLRWGHLTDDCSKVWIGESVTRGVRKSTKTNKSREFRLTESLRAMLLNRRPKDWKPDDLVFPAVKGGAIDDHNFRNRAWVTVLKVAGVTYRKPYNTRHTFISHALAQGMNPMTIAKMTGHDPEILFKNYAADIQGGLQLPEII
jgi:integrase